MCSWILATFPAMSPTVVSIWARAMRSGAATPRLWLGVGAAPDPVVGEGQQLRVVGRLDREQVPPRRGDHALGAGPAVENERPAGRAHGRQVGAGEPALELAQAPADAGVVEEHDHVAPLERLQLLVLGQADAVAL